MSEKVVLMNGEEEPHMIHPGHDKPCDGDAPPGIWEEGTNPHAIKPGDTLFLDNGQKAVAISSGWPQSGQMYVPQFNELAGNLKYLLPPKPYTRRIGSIRIAQERVFDWLMDSLSCRFPKVQLLMSEVIDPITKLRSVYRGLPEGTKLLGVHLDPLTRCFHFTVEHPSFDEVPEGMPIPQVFGDVLFEMVTNVVNTAKD